VADSIEKGQRRMGLQGVAIVLAVVLLLVAPQWQANAFGGDDRNIEKYAVKRVHPAYPPMAKKYKIEGVVTVEIKVGSDGKVKMAEFVKGHSVFRSVSLDAAKGWELKPPAEGEMDGTINFTFRLSE
jgi:TonB family protein